MKSTHLTVRLSENTLSEIDHFAEREGGISRSEAVRSLIERALSIGTLADEIAKRVTAPLNEAISAETTRLAETEERLAKVCSRGTKASLAALVAMTTYLPPAGNVLRANHNLLLNALEKEGYDVLPQNVDMDLAALSEWEGLGPEELFAFAWEAGGRVQRTGVRASYGAAVKGVRAPSPRAEGFSAEEYESNPILRGAAWFDAHFGEGFYDEWVHMLGLKRSRDRNRALHEEGVQPMSSAQAMDYAREDEEYENTLEMLQEAARDTVDPAYNGLVFDPTEPPFWRAMTAEEKAERTRALVERFGRLGLDFEN